MKWNQETPCPPCAPWCDCFGPSAQGSGAGFGGGAVGAAAAAAAAAAGLARGCGGGSGRAAVIGVGLELGEILAGEDRLPLLQLVRAAAGGRDRQLEDRQRLGEDALPRKRLRGEAAPLALPREQRLGRQDEPGPLGDAARQP